MNWVQELLAETGLEVSYTLRRLKWNQWPAMGLGH